MLGLAAAVGDKGICQAVVAGDEGPDELLRPAERSSSRPENDLARLSDADEHLAGCGAERL